MPDIQRIELERENDVGVQVHKPGEPNDVPLKAPPPGNKPNTPIEEPPKKDKERKAGRR